MSQKTYAQKGLIWTISTHEAIILGEKISTFCYIKAKNDKLLEK